LVRNGDMTSGQLVSFLLYLQSLSDAFASIGWVFSSLTQAVGAADKVFELMNRKPRIKTPTPDESQTPPPYEGILGIEALKTRRQRTIGLHPESARGEIVLENVNMSYPARPQRQILNGLSLKIEPGTLCRVASISLHSTVWISALQELYVYNVLTLTSLTIDSANSDRFHRRAGRSKWRREE
jgi:ATP-binding cassette subfamily B (MDR/TAP) protein 9